MVFLYVHYLGSEPETLLPLKKAVGGLYSSVLIFFYGLLESLLALSYLFRVKFASVGFVFYFKGIWVLLSFLRDCFLFLHCLDSTPSWFVSAHRSHKSLQRELFYIYKEVLAVEGPSSPNALAVKAALFFVGESFISTGLSFFLAAVVELEPVPYMFFKAPQFRLVFKFFFFFWVASFLLLGFLGAKPVEFPYSELSIGATCYYFGFFLIYF